MGCSKKLIAVAATLLLGFANAGVAAPRRDGAPSTTARPKPSLQKQLEAMRSAIVKAWNPAGFDGKIVVRVRLKRDRSIDGLPEIVSDPMDAAHYQAAAISAVRAVTSNEPFTMLDPEFYDRWKEIEVEFVPANFSQ